MWSGPRNISTAMMYAFANRPDCTAWDEPFYAWYLKTTGLDHPLADQVIAAGDTDASRVIAACTCTRADKTLFYQKHMCQHMLPGLDRQWIASLNNAFLIRAPEKVLASYHKKRAQVTLDDIGFVQQRQIFDQICDHLGHAPPVIDSERFLQNPRAQLEVLCAALAIPFTTTMLSWPAGPKKVDGIWANHWYGAAWKSTGFATPSPRPVDLPDHLQKIAEQARPGYEALRKFAIQAKS